MSRPSIVCPVNQLVQSTHQIVQSTCAINLCKQLINLRNQMCPGDGHLCHQHVPRRRSFLKDRSGGKLLPNKQVILRFALFPLQYFCPTQKTPNCPAHPGNQSLDGLDAGLTTFLSLLQFAETRWEKKLYLYSIFYPVVSTSFSFLNIVVLLIFYLVALFSNLYQLCWFMCVTHHPTFPFSLSPHLGPLQLWKVPLFSSSRRIS